MQTSIHIQQSEYQTRAEKLLAEVRRVGLNGVTLFDRDYILYYTGFAFIPTERPIAFIMNAKGDRGLFVPRLEAEHAKANAMIDHVAHYLEYPYTPHPMDAFQEMLSPFLTNADLLLPTAGEAQAITGEADENSAAQKLALKPGAVTVLKRGPAGCSIYQQDKKIDVSGFSVTEIDPTGAGDCFSAAFIAGLEAGWPLEQIGRFANAAGALAVTKLGPMEGAPFRSQVESLYA